MKPFLLATTLAAALGLATPQCLTPGDQDFDKSSFSKDLSPISDFGFELFRQFAPGNSRANFFFSPYSIWTAFVLASFAAEGNTRKQLEQALRLETKLAMINKWKRLDEFYRARQANTSAYVFNIANKAYFDDTLPVKPCIAQLLPREVEVVDFTFPNHRQAAQRINGFASANTQGRIPEIVTADDVMNSAMVLLNTAYFKGTWQYQFKAARTTMEPFFPDPNAQPVNVPMMKQIGQFRYNDFDQIQAQVLELPYSGEDLSMYIFLPEPGVAGWNAMMSRLSGQNLRAATHPKNLGKRTVDVQMPKFKIEQTLENELISAMSNLGVRDIFDSRLVDLTAFGPLFNTTLEKVIHKAFVEVNEEGTEAAAATALIFVTRSGGPREIPVSFKLDRPFVFLIRDNNTQNILFLGAYKDPINARPT